MLHKNDQSLALNAARLPRQKSEFDRRGEVRHIALLRVALLHVGDSKELCVVRNISASGLSARVYRKLASGDQVQVEFKSGELLGGSVVWEGDCEIGINFLKPIDVESVLASRWITETGRGRNLPRIDISCAGRLSLGSESMGVQLLDISQSGAKIRTEAPVVEHAKVILTLPGLPPAAAVARWVRDDEIGLSFNECISFDRLARWIQDRRAASFASVAAPTPGQMAAVRQ